MKRLITKLIVALCFCFLIAGFSSQAAAADTIASGDCGSQGNNITWVLDSSGVLTISGHGEMADFDPYDGTSPWQQWGLLD